jgi:hypothetical protein
MTKKTITSSRPPSLRKPDYLVSEDRAVHSLPQHVHEYLERNGVKLRRAREFCEDLKALVAG